MQVYTRRNKIFRTDVDAKAEIISKWFYFICDHGITHTGSLDEVTWSHWTKSDAAAGHVHASLHQVDWPVDDVEDDEHDWKENAWDDVDHQRFVVSFTAGCWSDTQSVAGQHPEARVRPVCDVDRLLFRGFMVDRRCREVVVGRSRRVRAVARGRATHDQMVLMSIRWITARRRTPVTEVWFDQSSTWVVDWSVVLARWHRGQRNHLLLTTSNPRNLVQVKYSRQHRLNFDVFVTPYSATGNVIIAGSIYGWWVKTHALFFGISHSLFVTK